MGNTFKMKVFLLCVLFAGAWAFEETLEVEGRDKLGSMRDEIKRCLGIEKWVWMTKVQTLEQVKNCVRHATMYPNPDAYLNCIGLKQAWYKGKAGVFRASGDNLLMCLMAFRTLHGLS